SGFDTIAQTLLSAPPRPEQYKDAAEKVATLALSGPGKRAIFICHPSYQDPGVAQEEPRCARRVIENLATRAYRRAPTLIEIETLLKVNELGRTQYGARSFSQTFSDY